MAFRTQLKLFRNEGIARSLSLLRSLAILLKKCSALLLFIFWVPLKKPYECFSVILEWAFDYAVSTTRKVLVATLTFLAIVWLSVLSYATFYNLYLPTAELTRPVNLKFSVCHDGVGVCSFPSSNVSFVDRNPSRQVLGSGEAYQVVLVLDVPECPANRDLGMFMVVIRMLDKDGQITLESHRSVVLKYKSLLTRIISTIVWSPFYHMGLSEEKQQLTIEMFSQFIDSYYNPAVGVTVEIQNHRVQIYSAELKLFAHFSGLKYLLYKWPILSAIMGTWFNFCTICFFLCIAAYKKIESLRYMSRSLHLSALADGNENTTEDGSADSADSVTIDESESTQTKGGDDSEDLDVDDLHLEQSLSGSTDDADEPDLELLTELRQRRVH